MRRLSLLLALLIAALVGCGDGTKDSSGGRGSAQGAASPSPDSGGAAQDVALASLIGLDDLPAEAETTEPLQVSACDPLQILDVDGSQAAKSPMFAIGSVQVQEAVGVFTARKLATDAYDELTSSRRLSCISEAIASQGGVSVMVRRSSGRVTGGDEAQAFVFRVRQLDSGQRNSIEVASVRFGNSVASLILLNTSEASAADLTPTVVGAAAEQLARGSKS